VVPIFKWVGGSAPPEWIPWGPPRRPGMNGTAWITNPWEPKPGQDPPLRFVVSEPYSVLSFFSHL